MTDRAGVGRRPPSPPRFGLIGDPVQHSLSPIMHRAAFRELGLEARYDLVLVPSDRPEGVARAMRGLAAEGGGNVTVPHKRRAAGALEVATEVVRRTGACNCFWQDDAGRLSGDNTDVGGIRRVIESMPGFDPVGARVLVIGAGGAGAAAVVAALGAGAAIVQIRNRTESKIPGLIAAVEDPRVSGGESGSGVEGWNLVIQATSLGLAEEDPLPLSVEGTEPAHALDLVYRPGGTPWIRHARTGGWVAEDGLRVLLEQGVLSLERWTGAGVPARVRAAMRKALVAAARS
ncbi:MAG: shikimate dehydrogenase [Gemmatimonadota bacterium]